MDKKLRVVLGGVTGVGVCVIFAGLFHLGGNAWRFSQLACAILGGCLTLFAATAPKRYDEQIEPWLGYERLAWIFIGCGLLFWGMGESIWLYYTFSNLSPFPSLADVGYSSLPPLVFIGLLLQPSSGIGSRRLLVLLDSLIAMVSMLTIGWYLLLGPLALSSEEDMLAKFLGLYYPTADIALLSCVILLFVRSQGSLYQAMARRVSLTVTGVGLCFFVSSDFLFNIQQNAGTYVIGTWVDLGWPLGMLLIGTAAYLRRFSPLTPGDMIERRLRQRAQRSTIGPAQVATYGMLGILCLVLVLNVLDTSKSQEVIRPVLVLLTVLVIILVVIRQLLTIYENECLSERRASTLARLELANQRIEEQARAIAERNAELEHGIRHLKGVHASIANGNLRARARLSEGALLPLAGSLNLMADRLMHLEQSDHYAQYLTRALQELIMEIERAKTKEHFNLPVSCRSFPELVRLVYVIGLKDKSNDATVSSSGIVPGSLPPQLFNRSGVPLSYSGQISQPLTHVGPQMTEVNKVVSKGPDTPSKDESITPVPEIFLQMHKTQKASPEEKEPDTPSQPS